MILNEEALATRERGYELLRALVPIVTTKPKISKETGLPDEELFGWNSGVYYHFPGNIFAEEELYIEQPGGIVS